MIKLSFEMSWTELCRTCHKRIVTNALVNSHANRVLSFIYVAF